MPAELTTIVGGRLYLFTTESNNCMTEIDLETSTGSAIPSFDFNIEIVSSASPSFRSAATIVEPCFDNNLQAKKKRYYCHAKKDITTYIV